MEGDRRDEGGVSAFFRGDEGGERTYCLALSLDFKVVSHVALISLRRAERVVVTK